VKCALEFTRDKAAYRRWKARPFQVVTGANYGSYSGATPNEKVSYDKLTETTPLSAIESDAMIVVLLLLVALLEYTQHPEKANVDSALPKILVNKSRGWLWPC